MHVGKRRDLEREDLIPQLAFSRPSRPAARMLMLALMAPLMSPAAALAQDEEGPGKQPVIDLPPNPGGETDGFDDVAAPGEQTEEDFTEPPAPVPPPEAPAPVPETEPIEPEPERPAPEPAPVAPAPATPAPTPTPALPAPAPVPPPAAPPAPVPPPAPAAPAPVEAAAPEAAPDKQPRRARDKQPRRGRRAHRPIIVTSPAPAPAPVPAASAVAVAPAPTATVMRVSSRDLRRLSGRTHTVQDGESLWSIASAMLGERASDERVSVLVQRLWAVNEARIGTGDRDVLPVGVRLQLRAGKEARS